MHLPMTGPTDRRSGRLHAAKTLALLGLLMLLISPLRAQQTEQALYWEVSREGQLAGYLLGTIHSEDPRVLDFNTDFVEQLNSCEVFAMEMVPDLPTLQRLTEVMHFDQPGELERHLGEQRFARVMAALAGYQVPDDWKARMKIWAVMMTLSVPPPQTGFFMDLSLSLRAAGSGLKVQGLETLEEQLSFLENMPIEQQLTLLDLALADYQKVAEVHDQMVDVYVDGGLGELEKLSDEQFSRMDQEIEHYFMSQGIDARNQRMLGNLLPMLRQSRVFVAVGALHLPGEQGLLNLLRQQGFSLKPLPLPLNRAAH